MVITKQITDIQKQKLKARPLEKMVANEVLGEINRDFGELKTATTAKKIKLDYVDILNSPINADLSQKIDLLKARTALVLPFFQIGKKIRVAVVDPQKIETQKFLTELHKDGLETFLALASRTGLLAKIEQIKTLRPHRPAEFRNKDAEKNLKDYELELRALEKLDEETQTLSAKESLNRIFIGALRTGASDVHFQPDERKVDLRFRVDGILQKIVELNHKVGNEILNQLKYESKLRLNVENTPQDGRTSFLANDRKIDVRVSTLPTEFGESAVCRILDSGKKVRTFEELGFANTTLVNLKKAMRLREGMILIVGPTGSGKTTTLYTLLSNFNNSERKIGTLENPIEYHLKNVVQSQIDEEAGYTFSNGLRALLRQDPDILMVGEIRDEATAETAAQAAMTGHIMLSTLHTSSATEVIPRLLNLKLRPFVLNSVLSLVVAQRLVRRPCEKCAIKSKPDDQQIKIFEKFFAVIKTKNPNLKLEIPKLLWQINGCKICGGTGYRGQIVIAESFLIDDQVKDLILRNASTTEIKKYIYQKGSLSFAEDGILKVSAGLTTLDEIERVIDLDLNLN